MMSWSGGIRIDNESSVGAEVSGDRDYAEPIASAQYGDVERPCILNDPFYPPVGALDELFHLGRREQ